MPKTAVAAALAALILAALTPTAQAMPMVPHHTVFTGLSADQELMAHLQFEDAVRSA